MGALRSFRTSSHVLNHESRGNGPDCQFELTQELDRPNFDWNPEFAFPGKHWRGRGGKFGCRDEAVVRKGQNKLSVVDPELPGPSVVLYVGL